MLTNIQPLILFVRNAKHGVVIDSLKKMNKGKSNPAAVA